MRQAHGRDIQKPRDDLGRDLLQAFQDQEDGGDDGGIPRDGQGQARRDKGRRRIRRRLPRGREKGKPHGQEEIDGDPRHRRRGDARPPRGARDVGPLRAHRLRDPQIQPEETEMQDRHPAPPRRGPNRIRIPGADDGRRALRDRRLRPDHVLRVPDDVLALDPEGRRVPLLQERRRVGRARRGSGRRKREPGNSRTQGPSPSR